ncbi:hypothetical protein GGI25_005931 [Coemansia spiralis]|uniref:Uncharacterized protein n=2 Tax=Coemansia TaxID=4863 RepID=A0A9W8G3L4_9FUNG|nr:hypothetical protein BX070DRAFT_229024 [Coemansia spiralis]KAJ1987220.1 hypothetical protein EDC05_005956 [Coemansia umbellata]KAJ2619155.1 hypothetical protein GGI26_006053 [Coemansia sp. RSA 1358]KAJ2670142.1 hypothetical protein GGI25_005931 [Coemansia spiralis]
MGLIKKIKGSYMFTQMEVGKYTKRRSPGHKEMPARPSEFIFEFDESREHSIETLPRSQTQPMPLTHHQSSMELSNPRSPSATVVESPTVRPRPTARAARSTMDMQSVYFAPGRNVTHDRTAASSVDYYVFTPSHGELKAMPLDKRRQHRGVVAPARGSVHQAEPEAEKSNNPFVERRRAAQGLAVQGWGSSAPFDDPIVGSGRGGIDPNDPRKYLNTPLYANQAGAGGVDLLA